MIQIQNVSKKFGDRSLFKDLSFYLNKKEKVGLLGRNGAGKSTLIKFITGLENPDEGSVVIPKGYRVGHLSQHISFSKETLLDEACLGLPEEEKYSSYLVEEILMGLGFTKNDFDKAPDKFSGGYQLRIQLAKILVSKPDALLLDEPTNFLDLPSIRWIEKFLKKWPGEMIVISHDREFLDATCNSMALLHREKLFRQKGTTSAIYELVAQDEEVYEKTRANVEKKKAHLQKFVDRFGAKATKAAQAQARVKAINKLPSLAKLSDFSEWDLSFPYTEYKGKKVLSVNNLSFAYSSHKTILENFNFTLYRGQKIACIGKNGKGKSTLLSLIAGFLKPNAGEITITDGVELGFFGQGQKFQLEDRSPIEEEIAISNPKLGYSQVRQICAAMMFPGDLAKKPKSVLSGGEKNRVLLGKTMAMKGNFLLLDEPTNHLDVESIESLIEAMQRYQGALLIVTHSEHVLKKLDLDHLIVFNTDSVDVFDGSYEEYLQSNQTCFFDEEEKKVKKPKKVVKPVSEKKEIQKQISSCEKLIEKEEIEAEKLQEELVDVMYKNDSKEIDKVSSKYNSKKEHIEKLYEKLDLLHNKLDDAT